MSVVNTSAGYFRVYSSVNGGPVTQIKEATTNQRAYYLFKIANTLYAGYYVTNLNSFKVDRFTGGTSWVQDGFLNGAAEVVQAREHSGNVYLLLTGYFGSTTNGQTWLAQYGTGGGGLGISNFTILKQTTGRVMRSFCIHPTTGVFYIADQDAGVGVGNMSIYSKDGGVEETLISWGAAVSPLDINLVGGTLYLLRYPGVGGFHVFSNLSDLTALATENVIDSTTIANSSGDFFRAVRSTVLHDLLIVSYTKSGNLYGSFSYDTTTDTLEVLADYPNGTMSHAEYGHFAVEGDNAILGVMGKFIELYHQAPDDPEPPVEPPAPSEDLTEEILIEVRPAPCNPVTLCWLNSLGVYETWCFEDLHGVFENEIKTKIEAEYERYVEDLETDTNTTGITSKTVQRSLKLGADNIDADVYTGLLDLFTSPAVFLMVSADPVTWQSVRVSPGSTRYSEYDRALEITIELPNMFVQRS
jgi:hypothetical protein